MANLRIGFRKAYAVSEGGFVIIAGLDKIKGVVNTLFVQFVHFVVLCSLGNSHEVPLRILQ